MDKKLQKIILDTIKEKGGRASNFDIYHDDRMLEYWMREEGTKMDDCCNECIRFHQDVGKDGNYYSKIEQQIRLLVDAKKIGKTDNEDYAIFLGGFHQLDCWYVKLWRFILYGKHNLLAIVSLIISIAALVVSIKK